MADCFFGLVKLVVRLVGLTELVERLDGVGRTSITVPVSTCCWQLKMKVFWENLNCRDVGLLESDSLWLEFVSDLNQISRLKFHFFSLWRQFKKMGQRFSSYTYTQPAPFPPPQHQEEASVDQKWRSKMQAAYIQATNIGIGIGIAIQCTKENESLLIKKWKRTWEGWAKEREWTASNQRATEVPTGNVKVPKNSSSPEGRTSWQE